MLAGNGADTSNVFEGEEAQNDHHEREETVDDQGGISDKTEVPAGKVEVASDSRRMILLNIHFDEEMDVEHKPEDGTRADREVG